MGYWFITMLNYLQYFYRAVINNLFVISDFINNHVQYFGFKGYMINFMRPFNFKDMSEPYYECNQTKDQKVK